MDLFNEKIVSRRKDGKDFAIIAGIVVLAVAVSFLVLLFLPGIAPFLVIGVIYLGYWLITQRNIEYEYAVTNGDIDIDMIISQRKRKKVFSGNCKDFELIARVKSDKYDGQIKNCKNVKDYSSHNDNADVWFIYSTQAGPAVILFEPTPQMIDCFFTFAPRKVYRY
mgnify:CR=1 FL=1